MTAPVPTLFEWMGGLATLDRLTDNFYRKVKADALLGPVFDYSNTWQLVINTSTTIITFLMVFLIQKSQNKDSLAIQLKLNELVAAHEFASNRLVAVEDMTEDELMVIKKYYSKLNEISMKEGSLQETHSIDEAHKDHEIKKDIEEKIVKQWSQKNNY